MRRSIQFGIFLAALLALSLSAGQGLAQECTGLPRSDLKVYRMEADHVTERSASPEEIARIARTSGMAHVPHPLIAIVYKIEGKVAVVHRLFASPGGGYCDAPKAVIIGIGVVSREVFLTPQAAKETCVKAALLAHEGEHDRMLGAAIHAFIQEYHPVLEQELRELKTKRASDQESAEKAFDAGLMVALARMLRQFKEEHVARIRQSLDSTDRLAELRQSCNGRLGNLEDDARQEEREI